MTEATYTTAKGEPKFSPTTPAPKGWLITSTSSGMSWNSATPILETGRPDLLNLDYNQKPL